MRYYQVYRVTKVEYFGYDVELIIVADGVEDPGADIILLEITDYTCTGVEWRDTQYLMKSFNYLEVGPDHFDASQFKLVIYDRAKTPYWSTGNVRQV